MNTILLSHTCTVHVHCKSSVFFLQCDNSVSEAGHFLLEIGSQASTCSTSDDALDLINRLGVYKSQYAAKQQGRITDMDNYAVMLWGTSENLNGVV